MKDDEAQVKGSTEQELITITQAEGARMIANPQNDDERKFAEDILKNPQRYNVVDKMPDSPPQGASPQGHGEGTPDGASATPQGGDEVPAETGSDEELVEISAKIPKSLLGNYAKDRAPQEAVLEALKGIREKDEVIDLLKAETQQSGSLKKRLEEYRRKKANLPAVPEEIQFDIGEVKLDDIPTDDSIYDPQNAGKLVNAFRAQQEQIKKLTEAVKKSHAQARQAVVDISTRGANSTEQELIDAVIEDQFEQVETLQKLDPKLATPKKFRELDAEVDQFWKNVAKAAGAKTLDGNTVARAAAMYADTSSEEGKALRERCAAANVKPPEGIEQHATIMKIHALREQHKAKVKASLKERFGRDVSDIDIVDFVPSYSKIYLDEMVGPNRLLQAKVEGAREALTPKPAGGVPVAREVPPALGGAPKMTLDSIDAGNLARLLARPSNTYSRDEALLVKDYYEKNGMSKMVPNDVIRIISQ